MAEHNAAGVASMITTNINVTVILQVTYTRIVYCVGHLLASMPLLRAFSKFHCVHTLTHKHNQSLYPACASALDKKTQFSTDVLDSTNKHIDVCSLLKYNYRVAQTTYVCSCCQLFKDKHINVLLKPTL